MLENFTRRAKRGNERKSRQWEEDEKECISSSLRTRKWTTDRWFDPGSGDTFVLQASLSLFNSYLFSYSFRRIYSHSQSRKKSLSVHLFKDFLSHSSFSTCNLDGSQKVRSTRSEKENGMEKKAILYHYLSPFTNNILVCVCVSGFCERRKY